jgi:5-methylcytosine-specific restriction endonuclease McrA
MKVLLLNASYEILDIRPLKKAVRLIHNGKAHKPSGYDDYHFVGTSCGTETYPTALVMSYYVQVPYKRLPITKANLLKRDNYTCQYCGRSLNLKTITVDHVLPKRPRNPKRPKGKHVWKNVVASCRTCNNKKDNLTPEEASMKLLSRPFIPQKSMMTMDDIVRYEAWKQFI